jgi:hypothetical protein
MFIFKYQYTAIAICASIFYYAGASAMDPDDQGRERYMIKREKQSLVEYVSSDSERLKNASKTLSKKRESFIIPKDIEENPEVDDQR